MRPATKIAFSLLTVLHTHKEGYHGNETLRQSIVLEREPKQRGELENIFLLFRELLRSIFLFSCYSCYFPLFQTLFEGRRGNNFSPRLSLSLVRLLLVKEAQLRNKVLQIEQLFESDDLAAARDETLGTLEVSGGQCHDRLVCPSAPKIEILKSTKCH